MMACPSNHLPAMIVSARAMTDNLRPERPRRPLMPPISGSARQAHGAPFKTSATSERPLSPFGTSARQAPVSDEANFLAALPVIDDVAGQVCRRHRLNPTESDDFRSEVRL